MDPRDLLTDLSRRLGDPDMDAVLLGEGNTSVRDGGSMLVKASGAELARAVPADFVRVELDAAIAVVDDDSAGDAEVDALFARVAAAEGRRPSVEALLHAVLYEATDAAVIAHSHPTWVNALLCSDHAELLVSGALYPDQIVVLGAAPLLVPYVDPGLALAREVRALLAGRTRTDGEAPGILYLRNHGMFAAGATARQVLGATAMAQKCARVLLAAGAGGTVRFLPEAEVARIAGRPDEQYRRALLAQEEV